MQTFIMLTRLVSEEVNPSFNIQSKEMTVKNKVATYCPDIEWVNDYAILGPWDYLDVIRAPDMEAAMHVSALVRYYGGCHTELWPAVSWDKFKTGLQELIQVMEKD